MVGVCCGMAARMDLSDVIERAELHQELASRVGTVRPGARKPRLDGQLLAAWKLFEAATQLYGSARPEELVNAMRRAHAQYTAPHGQTPGFLFYAFRELVPEWDGDGDQLPIRVEWAARSMEAVRAGLRDEAFAMWMGALEESMAALAPGAELVDAS